MFFFSVLCEIYKSSQVSFLGCEMKREEKKEWERRVLIASGELASEIRVVVVVVIHGRWTNSQQKIIYNNVPCHDDVMHFVSLHKKHTRSKSRSNSS